MNINYWTGEPQQTSNRNVPDGIAIVGEVSYTSGEYRETYYVQRYDPPHPEFGGWALWKVGDWKGMKPQPANAEEWHRVGIVPVGTTAIRKGV